MFEDYDERALFRDEQMAEFDFRTKFVNFVPILYRI